MQCPIGNETNIYLHEDQKYEASMDRVNIIYNTCTLKMKILLIYTKTYQNRDIFYVHVLKKINIIKI